MVDELDELRDLVQRWEDRHASKLQPFETGDQTTSGIPLKPVHTPLDLNDGDVLGHHRGVGLPGESPYKRGYTPGMYREQLWVMGMYSGRASPEETNLRIRSLLDSGQKGFSVALDLPTQNGYDSDHPLARGEVGKVGVPIDCLEDMRLLLQDIPLDEVRQIRTTANAIGPIALALFIAAAESHGYSPSDFKVMFQNDVLKEYTARGTYIFPPEYGLRFSTDVVEYCAKQMPHWEPIEFCGYHIRDSGADAIQEVAIALANGCAYLDAAVARGLDIDDFASSIFLFLSAGTDFLEEVAKFRAARGMWTKIMQEKYRTKKPESSALKIFVYTLGSALTAQEPLNNTIRVAYEALAAVLGGVQTIATSSYDEALGLPSEEAVQVALRTQQIIAYETGVCRTADPLGGAYSIEYLTDQLVQGITDYMKRIEAQGGALAAINNGWLKAQLDEGAYRLQRNIDSGERPLVGVNRFQKESTTSFNPLPSVPPAEEERQIKRLQEIRRTRDNPGVEKALAEVGEAARGSDNTVPAILGAIRLNATVGEISAELRDVWGTYRPG